VGITDKVLSDHQARKGHGDTTWFTQADLQRLGIDLPVMSAMQTVQHTLRLRRAATLVETAGRLDSFSLQDAGCGQNAPVRWEPACSTSAPLNPPTSRS
jgi:hypothetical protein